MTYVILVHRLFAKNDTFEQVVNLALQFKVATYFLIQFRDAKFKVGLA